MPYHNPRIVTLPYKNFEKKWYYGCMPYCLEYYRAFEASALVPGLVEHTD